MIMTIMIMKQWKSNMKNENVMKSNNNDVMMNEMRN